MGTWSSTAPTLAPGSSWSSPEKVIPEYRYKSSCYVKGTCAIARTSDHRIVIRVKAEGYNDYYQNVAKDVFAQCTVSQVTEKTGSRIFRVDYDTHPTGTRYYVFDAPEGSVVTVALVTYPAGSSTADATRSVPITVPERLVPGISVYDGSGFTAAEAVSEYTDNWEELDSLSVYDGSWKEA